MSDNPSALKHFYDQKLLDRMADALEDAQPALNASALRKLMPKLKPLEMKPRVRVIRDELHTLLPKDFRQASAVLLRSLKGGRLKSFDLWPYTEFVQLYGIDDPDCALKTLKEMTKLFTSEWAVRPFLTKDAKGTLKFLEACAKDSDVHVRRWASEGTRPRLPWGERLHAFVKDPQPTLRILELLKFDEQLYVRKSVANHLNDIAKDHPEAVIITLRRWKKEAGSLHAEKVDWIIHRALRTLIKDGHPGALKLIGVSDKPEISLNAFQLKPSTVKMGQRLEFRFQVRSKAKRRQKLVIDYVIHFVKANGTTSPKVFKMKTVELEAGAVLDVIKLHHIKPITTRVYYPGRHALEVQINGVSMGKTPWTLLV